MMASLSLRAFMLSGSLGELSVGDDDGVLRRHLGSPEDTGSGLQSAVINRYCKGKLEVSSIRGKVVLIAIYIRRGQPSGEAIELVDDLPADCKGSPASFCSWLMSEQRAFETLLADGDSFVLRIDGGATVCFDEGRLDSLQATTGDR